MRSLLAVACLLTAVFFTHSELNEPAHCEAACPACPTPSGMMSSERMMTALGCECCPVDECACDCFTSAPQVAREFFQCSPATSESEKDSVTERADPRATILVSKDTAVRVAHDQGFIRRDPVRLRPPRV